MAEIDAKIKAQGDKIRELKAAKSAKDVIEPEVKTLLALKAEFKVKKPSIISTPASVAVLTKLSDSRKHCSKPHTLRLVPVSSK